MPGYEHRGWKDEAEGKIPGNRPGIQMSDQDNVTINQAARLFADCRYDMKSRSRPDGGATSPLLLTATRGRHFTAATA
ncbi:unnamed protein product [Arctogadus glacialis]